MASIAQQIAAAPGQPASVRIGVVTETTPLTISAQGTSFTDVGFLSSYTPAFQDVVALLGQSSQAGADPASWLCLGKIVSEPSTQLIQAGSESLNVVAATGATLAVVFDTAFLDVPAMSTNIVSGAGATANWGSRAINVTNVGFTIFIFGPSNTFTTEVQWTATEQTQ